MLKTLPVRHLLLLLCLVWCSACEDRTIRLHPGLPEPDDETVVLDFTFRKSTNYIGFVKFQIFAHNIVAYNWNFGFIDKNNKLVTSNASSPGIFFPANGSYQVTLKGTDREQQEISVTKIVTITSYP
jgi:PKD repeat protein